MKQMQSNGKGGCKGDDSTVQGNIKEWGHTNKSKSRNEYTG